MANVFDAARYILKAKGPMTTLKLHKLCYYVQAWSLVWDDSELFPEEFEAWANGPVCRELFDWHRTMYRIRADDVPEDRLTGPDPFSQDQKDTLDAVLRDYADHGSWWLRELIQMETPWLKAGRRAQPGVRHGNIIDKETMAWYYDSL